MIHIRTALAAGMLVVGGAAIAAAQQSPPATAPQAHAQHAQAGRHMREGFGPRMRGQLFKGITLSDAEKSNIKNVQAKYAPQMKALREQFKPQLQAAREARQRGGVCGDRELTNYREVGSGLTRSEEPAID